MQTVIVPVDFSETSLNAARYAVQLLTGHYGVNMILHHVYEKSSYASEANEKLEKLKAELRHIGIVKINTLAEESSDFIRELEKLARHQQADMIIMGITGRTTLEQSLIGSNTLKMVNTKVCPILIVPENAKYRDVKNVLLTSDFKNVVNATPSGPIRKVLKPFHPQLHIINVDTSHYVAITEEHQDQKAALAKMFHDLKPEFYFLGLPNIDEGINQFAKDKNVDMIVVIHKDHSLLSKLFVKSHTKKLAYQSEVPVLAVHE